MPMLGPAEIMVVAVLALLVFGPERLPEIARTVGKAAAEMRRMAAEAKQEFESGLQFEDEEDDEDEEPPPAARVGKAVVPEVDEAGPPVALDEEGGAVARRGPAHPNLTAVETADDDDFSADEGPEGESELWEDGDEDAAPEPAAESDTAPFPETPVAAPSGEPRRSEDDTG